MKRYRGSILARDIENDNKREAYKKAKALRMKKLKDEYEKRKKSVGGDNEC